MPLRRFRDGVAKVFVRRQIFRNPFCEVGFVRDGSHGRFSSKFRDNFGRAGCGVGDYMVRGRRVSSLGICVWAERLLREGLRGRGMRVWPFEILNPKP